MRFEYDKTVDAGYVRLRKATVSRTVRLDDWRLVDYDENNEPIGVELLGLKQRGVDTHDLPAREEIERLLARRNVRIFA
jgi:uncharacterized protein YuzE